MIKRNVIVKDDKKKYSYIQPRQQQSIDICTVIANTNRTNKRKRPSEESSVDQQSKFDIKTTVTVRKKYKYDCIQEGCTNQVQNRGLCFKHGAEVTLCSHEGCSNKVMNSGVCYKHGAKRLICKHEGCNNIVKNRGVCVKHGAKRLICKHEGCKNRRVNGGVCVKHGAIVKPRKKCEREGCDNYVQRFGVCRRHGAFA